MKYLRVREEKISQWLTSKCLLIHTAATCLHGMVARPSGRSGLVLAFAHDGVERICVVWHGSVNIQWRGGGGGIFPRDKQVSAVVNTNHSLFGWSSTATQRMWCLKPGWLEKKN